MPLEELLPWSPERDRPDAPAIGHNGSVGPIVLKLSPDGVSGTAGMIPLRRRPGRSGQRRRTRLQNRARQRANPCRE
eukprot:3659639-Amphidinium_carterae.1